MSKTDKQSLQGSSQAINVSKNGRMRLDVKMYVAIAAPLVTGVFANQTYAWSDVRIPELPYMQVQNQQRITSEDQTNARVEVAMTDISHSAYLSNLYFFIDAANVDQLITSTPRLRGILQELRLHVNEVFGLATQIVLRVLRDEDEETSSLSAQITCLGDTDEALEKLDQLRDTWWYDASADLDGKMTVDVEIV